ncbi:hypothetical protein N0V84_005040 [Fusarium piperis]|uniref:F-box domain-containing protein n=1 Tax=Fusarium piperis TaxID=1435070 RepID=A0A9W8WEH6_9HYPO|nr:hypothetical protein N0V84_005040 [Fusarium piperis]
MPSSTTLPSKNASPAKLFRKFAWNPEPRLDYVIRDLPLPQTSPIRQMSASSSMGRIDILPPELLLMVLNLLDFQALSRLSRVSHRAKTTVEGLAAYRELFEHAPDVLVALGKTRLLRYHSAALLRQTLRESRCVSCFDFGAYLNLPTCERVCLECLRRNYASRVVPVNTARECFHLTNKHLKKIPILYSIPGEYGVQDGFQFRRRVLRMVSAKQAKQLAIEVHGSAENVANLLPTTQTQDMPFEKFNTFQWLRETPLEPPGYDLSRDAERFFDRDLNGGMASIRMPCLSGTIADRGWSFPMAFGAAPYIQSSAASEGAHFAKRRGNFVE